MLPIVVAGGGVGGLTFARAAALCRIPVVVVEPALATDLTSAGSGIGLWGPAMSSLRAVGVADSDLWTPDISKRMVCAG